MYIKNIYGSEVGQKWENQYHILMCIYMQSRILVQMNLFAGKQ